MFYPLLIFFTCSKIEDDIFGRMNILSSDEELKTIQQLLVSQLFWMFLIGPIFHFIQSDWNILYIAHVASEKIFIGVSIFYIPRFPVLHIISIMFCPCGFYMEFTIWKMQIIIIEITSTLTLKLHDFGLKFPGVGLILNLNHFKYQIWN